MGSLDSDLRGTVSFYKNLAHKNLNMTLRFLLRMAWAVLASSISGGLAGERCESSFNPEVHSIARIEYDIDISRAKINKGKLYVVMNDGYSFKHLLSGQCEDFPRMHLEVQEGGFEDESWETVEILKKKPRHANALTSDVQRGVVSMPKHFQIDLCKTYNIRFSMNDKKSPTIVFGPFDKELEAEIIEKLPVTAEDVLNVEYEETDGGFIAKWDPICARSLKIFLQEGEESYREFDPIENVRPETFNNSMKFSSQPCTKYTLQVESYWTTKPKEFEGNLFDAEDTPFFSSPEASSFGYIEMNTTTAGISWDLSSYMSGCAVNIGYNIILQSGEGDQLLVLKEVEDAEEDQRMLLDIKEVIRKQNRKELLEDLEVCQVRMNMWYETASGKKENNTFVGSLSDNYEGHFVENAMSLTDAALSGGSRLASSIRILDVFFIIASGN